MKSLHNVAVLVAVVALLGSIGASLQQQVFGPIVIYDKEQLTKLTDEFENALSDAAERGNMQEIKGLLDEYNRNVMTIFGIGPSDTEGDPPSEVDPPDPDAESSDQNLKEPGKLELPN